MKLREELCCKEKTHKRPPSCCWRCLLRCFSCIGTRNLFNLLSCCLGKAVISIPKLKEKTVYLTIDDFPSRDVSYGHALLDLLKRHGVKATFFVIAYQVRCKAGNHALMKRAHNEGHGFGNHMAVDTCYTGSCEADFEKTLIETENLIQEADPDFKLRKPKLFRPPHGKSDKTMRKVLQRNDYVSILGDVYSMDPEYDTEPEFHAKIILSNVKKGSIIILHTPETYMRTKTFAILEEIIPKIKKMGYKFGLLNEYFQGEKEQK